MEKALVNNFLAIFGVIAVVIAVVTWVLTVYLLRQKQLLKRMKEKAFMDIELERKRISSEMHDVTSSSLLKIKSELKGKIASAAQPNAQELMDAVVQEIDQLYVELANTTEKIYPKGFLSEDWAHSIHDLCHQYQSALDIDVVISMKSQWSKHSAHESYRIIQEHLSNIIKHAQPTFLELFIDEEEEKVFIEFIYSDTQNLGDKTQTSSHSNWSQGRGKLILNNRYKKLMATYSLEIENNVVVERIQFPLQ